MTKFHISQDETGCWQLTFEDADGNLSLISHQFPSPEHLIEDARELVVSGRAPGAVIIIGPPQSVETPAANRERARPYAKPAPRRALDL